VSRIRPPAALPAAALAVALAAALAACTDDRTPTAPDSRRASADQPRLTLTPQSGAAASTAYTRRIPFTQAGGRGAAATVTSPKRSAFQLDACFDTGLGTYDAELTLPSSSLILTLARSAFVGWSTEQNFFHRGTSRIGELSVLYLNGRSVFSQGHTDSRVEPGVQVTHRAYGYTLKPDELEELRKGGTLRVRINLLAYASLPFSLCPLSIAGAQAKTNIYVQPFVDLST
jgi:hypothetical protein